MQQAGHGAENKVMLLTVHPLPYFAPFFAFLWLPLAPPPLPPPPPLPSPLELYLALSSLWACLSSSLL